MIVEIIPAERLPRNLNSFSYKIPAELSGQIKVGQIVEIYLRNKKTSGIITEIKNEKTLQQAQGRPKFKLKEINKILFSEPLITKNQLELIEKISKDLGISAGILAKSMIPEIPKRLQKNANTERTEKTQKTLKKKNIQSSHKSSGSSVLARKLFYYSKQEQAIKLIKKSINKSGQTLILVPEKILIDKLANKLNLKSDKYFACHSEIAQTKFFQNYLEILSGRNKIIIGTKISVLLPFANLSQIFIWDEHDWNHKQSDINPRFDAREIVDWLAQKNNCNLTLFSPAPSIENYNQSKSQKVKKLKSNNLIKIINLQQEKLKGNYTFLSDELIHNISANLQANKKTFILHNRKGTANYIFCKDCNYIFKCPECDITLTYHSTDNLLHCSHCNLIREIDPFCPKCNSPKIEFKSQGIEKIVKAIKKEFPNIKIQEYLPTGQAGKNIKIKINSDTQVIISTQLALNKLNFADFNLIAFTNFDQLLNHSNFRASEKAYQLFYKIKSETSADFLIQTSSPNNFVVSSILQNTPEIFYSQELINRQNFNYPPFVKLIKITHQNTSEKLTESNCQKLITQLNSVKNIEILGPIPNYPKKIRGKFKYHIILKTPLNFTINSITKLIPNDFILDINPEKLN